jgi:hypothetical protein
MREDRDAVGKFPILSGSLHWYEVGVLEIGGSSRELSDTPRLKITIATIVRTLHIKSICTFLIRDSKITTQ